MLPGFRQVGGADRFVVRLHERLEPPCDHPEVEADKRAAIETKLEKLLKDCRLVPAPERGGPGLDTASSSGQTRQGGESGRDIRCKLSFAMVPSTAQAEVDVPQGV